MKKKIFKTTVTTMALCAIMASTAFAAYSNWTEYETSYVKDAVTSSKVSKRYTENKKFGVYAKDKTMWSSPTAMVVNSEGQSRSGSVTISDTEEYLYGTGNTCEKGYNYKLRIKPAWNQVGKDSIKYKFSVR